MKKLMLLMVMMIMVVGSVMAIEPKVALHFSDATYEHSKTEESFVTTSVSTSEYKPSYMTMYYSFQRQLEEEKIPYIIVTDSDISNGNLVSGSNINYPILISLGTNNISDAVGVNIVDYVDKGGILLDSGLFGITTSSINSSLLGVDFLVTDLHYVNYNMYNMNATKLINHSVVEFFPDVEIDDYKRKSDIVNATLTGTQLMTWRYNQTNKDYPYVVNNSYGSGQVIWWAEHRGFMNTGGSYASITPTSVMFYNTIRWAFEKQGVPFIQVWRWKKNYQSATGGLRMDVDGAYHEVYNSGRTSDVKLIADSGYENGIPVYFFYGTQTGYDVKGANGTGYTVNNSIQQLCNHSGARIVQHFSNDGHISQDADKFEKNDFENINTITNETNVRIELTKEIVHEDSNSLNMSITALDTDSTYLYSILVDNPINGWNYATQMFQMWVYPSHVSNESRSTTPDYSSDPNIMGAWGFDTDSFSDDLGSYGNDIVLTNGTPQNVSDAWSGDNAINFNNDSYYKIADDDSLTPGKEFSVAFALKGEITETCYILSKAAYNGVNDYFVSVRNAIPDNIQIQLGDGTDSDQEAFYGGVGDNGWGVNNFIGNPNVSFESWHTFGFSYSAEGHDDLKALYQNNTYKWYIDGRLMGVGFFNELRDNGVAGITNGANDLYMSALTSNLGDATARCSAGNSYDHIVMSNETWTEDDFQRHYSEAMDLLITIDAGTAAGVKNLTFAVEDLIANQWNEIVYNITEYKSVSQNAGGRGLMRVWIPSGAYTDDYNNTEISYYLDEFNLYAGTNQSNVMNDYNRNWTSLFNEFWDWLNALCPHSYGNWSGETYLEKQYVAAGFGTTELQGVNNLLDYGFEYNAGDFVLSGIPSFVVNPTDKMHLHENNRTYDLITLPISHYFTTTGTNFDDFGSHTNETIDLGVDALYDAGLFINFYTHGQAAQMDYLLDAIGSKSNIWKTTYDDLNDWWRQRDSVKINSVSYVDDKTTLNITNNGSSIVSLLSIKMSKNISYAIIDGNYYINHYDDIFVLPDIDSGENIIVELYENATAYPSISFSGLTPENNTIQNSNIIINLTTSDDLDGYYSFVNYDSSLVGWWRFDYFNSTFTNDSSGNGNNGIISGADCTVDGAFGEGCSFDGVNDYINISSINLNLDKSNFSVSIWAYLIEPEQSSPLIQKGYTGGFAENGNGFYLRYRSTYEIQFLIGNNSGGYNHILTNTDRFTLNTWHNFIGTINGSHMCMYTDGILFSCLAIEDYNLSIKPPYDKINYIGRNDAANNYFNGSIDEVMIFNRSLSESEIKSLYDSSVNKYNEDFSYIEDGLHTWKGYVVDISGQVNQTETRQITFIYDNIPPNITNIIASPSDTNVYSKNQKYELNATIVDDHLDSAIVNFNGINYTPSQNGNVFNWSIKDLAVGEYSYYWYANDSAKNSNTTSVYYLNVTKATGLSYLTVSPSSPIIYYTQSTFVCSNNNPETSAILYIDSVDKTTENNTAIRRGVDSYFVNCSSISTQNYTAYSNTTTYTINQNASSCSLSTNSPQTYPSAVNVSFSCTNPESTALMYRDGTDVSSQNNTAIILGVSSYTYVANVSNTQNYTNASTLSVVTINKGDGTGFINISINGTERNYIDDSRVYYTSINASMNTIIGNLTLKINGTVYDNTNRSYYISSYLMNIGNIIVNASHSGNANYSASDKTYWINISLYSSYVTFNITEGWNIMPQLSGSALNFSTIRSNLNTSNTTHIENLTAFSWYNSSRQGYISHIIGVPINDKLLISSEQTYLMYSQVNQTLNVSFVRAYYNQTIPAGWNNAINKNYTSGMTMQQVNYTHGSYSEIMSYFNNTNKKYYSIIPYFNINYGVVVPYVSPYWIYSRINTSKVN